MKLFDLIKFIEFCPDCNDFDLHCYNCNKGVFSKGQHVASYSLVLDSHSGLVYTPPITVDLRGCEPVGKMHGNRVVYFKATI